MLVITLVVTGLVVWVMRTSFIALGDRITLGPFAERVVQNARHATLAALVGAAFATGSTSGDAAFAHWAIALTVTMWVATRTRTLAVIVLSGMGTLWVLTFAAAVQA